MIGYMHVIPLPHVTVYYSELAFVNSYMHNVAMSDQYLFVGVPNQNKSIVYIHHVRRKRPVTLFLIDSREQCC